MANILNLQTVIEDKNTTLDVALRRYTKSVLRALEEGNENLIVFPEKITTNEL